jgi:CelD/BcsL family acetyltransferase involved in cellulose biosynthesis
MTAEWIAEPVQLSFALGEWRLGAIFFPALVLDAHFTELIELPVIPPFERLSRGVEVLVVRSHPTDGRLPRLLRLPAAVRYVPSQYRHYYVDLQGSFVEYLQKFSGKSRSTLRRKVRKFAELSGGTVQWREFRARGEMSEFYRLAREISRKTYQERLLHQGLPESEEFRRTIAEAAAHGRSRGYILFSGGHPVAYLYCPIRDGVLLYEHLGYDPQFQRWSPGTVLQHLVLEKLFEEGDCRCFDFTEGEGAHKEFFATGSVDCADMYYFRPTLRNRSLLRLHAGLRLFSDALVHIVDRLGVKTRLKKLIRAHAREGDSVATQRRPVADA